MQDELMSLWSLQMDLPQTSVTIWSLIKAYLCSVQSTIFMLISKLKKKATTGCSIKINPFTHSKLQLLTKLANVTTDYVRHVCLTNI